MAAKSRIVGRGNVEITPQFIVKVAMAYGSLYQRESILIGSQEHIETTSYKNLFLHAIHGIGIHTMECKEMNESLFSIAFKIYNVQVEFSFKWKMKKKLL